MRREPAGDEEPIASQAVREGWRTAGCERCGGTGLEPEASAWFLTFRCPRCGTRSSYAALVCGTEGCDGVPVRID